MADTTLPPLRSSSSAIDIRNTPSSNSNDSSWAEKDVFPFLVHSQDSLTNGDAPQVDSAKLARQKRKRTSAEDQATLEAEYKRNPKPDKAARMEIVKKVSLGEKEVQIWFQNRRQNTRRKTRPLLAHEIAAFGLGGMAPLSSDTVSSSIPSDTSGTIVRLSSSHFGELDIKPESHHPAREVPQALHDTSAPFLSIEAKEHSKPEMDPTQRAATTTPKPFLSSQSSTGASFTGSPVMSESAQSLPRCPAMDLMNTASNSQPSTSAPATTVTMTSSRPGRIAATDIVTRSSSKVRLSLSLTGQAELVTTDVSPSRAHIQRPLSSGSNISLRRSDLFQNTYSAIPADHIRLKASSNHPNIPRVPSGRSRDARTWEFCCDADSRDELTTQAENESNGSAIAAISLIRSTSNSALKSNVNKRNAPAAKAHSSDRSKKPKFERASSSMAKLGSTDIPLHSPSGDSDKENRLPGEEENNPQPRNMPIARSQHGNRRRVLKESTTDPTPSVYLGRKLDLKISATGGLDIFEDKYDGREDQEVERFMRGEVSPSKKGDLDCIQGLLSLSQGSWR